MVLVYSTFPNKTEAKKIGERLVQKNLAGCCNIFPIDSIYWWKKKIVNDKEFAMIIKTKKENFKKIEKFILKNHSYDTPCVFEMPVNRVNKKYLKYLNL